MKSRWAGTWLAVALNAVVAAAGCVVLAHLSRGGAPHIDPPPATDLHFLSESMLVDENAVAQEPSFVAAAPHATSFRFEGVPHGISVRRPAEFAAQINRFAATAFAAPGRAE